MTFTVSPQPLVAICRWSRAADGETLRMVVNFGDSEGVNGVMGHGWLKGLIGIEGLNGLPSHSEFPLPRLLNSERLTVRRGTMASCNIHTVAAARKRAV